MAAIESLGARTLAGVQHFGDFWRFAGRAGAWTLRAGLGRRTLPDLVRQFYLIGTRSIPVVVITGAFVGAVLAVQAVEQFKGIGMMDRMGTVVNLSVLRELGPVLAAVILAGRVGGGLTAELGTMRVTEQIDALRAMGTDPIRVLVVPRVFACVLLIPVLVIYASFMGILGGYVMSVYVYGVSPGMFWDRAARAVEYFDILYGPVKSLFSGLAIALLSCFKGVRCAPGAAGVGRACTESFVASCLAIIVLDFFLGVVLNVTYDMLYGPKMIM